MILGATCFSGIGAPECAASWIDWRWSAEIEPFPAAVHAHRFPGSVNLGDVLAPGFLARAEPVDILVGGPPCQAFSIAGLRGGLGDDRGNLTMRWVQIIHAVRPRFAVTENVPGWLSMPDNAFGCFLAGLVGADGPLLCPGGTWPSAGMAAGPLGRAAWRVLDAQYFGVAQRRQRVFVVFCPGEDGDPAAVLFERQGVPGHPPARREAGQDVARPIAAGSARGSGYRNDADTAENLIAFDTTQVTSKANYSNPRPGDPRHTLAAGAHAPAIAHCLNAHPSRRIDAESETFIVAPPLTRNPYGDHESREGLLVPTAYRVTGNDGAYETPDHVGALGTNTDRSAQVLAGGEIGVRRLMPIECERLQGMPDNWTLIRLEKRNRHGNVTRLPWAKDGPRYKAIGNSMAVPVIGWVLNRIRMQMETGIC